MKQRAWLPYVAPMALYMVFLQAQNSWPRALVWIYPIKTVVVGCALWYFRRAYDELRGRPVSGGRLAVAVGLLVIVIWIALDPFYPKLTELIWRGERLLHHLFHAPVPPPPGPPADPTVMQPGGLRWMFLAFRVAGACLVVPVMEELFWRGCAIRWLVREDFKQVPLGTFTWMSFGVTVLFFGLEHDQWLAGLIGGALYNWLYYRTKNLWACVVAHAVSNAALAGWVLATGDWKFW